MTLTILPALVPTLDALPARANETAPTAEFPDPPPKIALLIHPTSKNIETVDNISSQKKNPKK